MNHRLGGDSKLTAINKTMNATRDIEMSGGGNMQRGRELLNFVHLVRQNRGVRRTYHLPRV